MLEVACIKWGTKYGPEYVNKLHNMVKRNITIPYKFVCYTDDPTGLKCKHKPLPKGIEGWWNKLYLFSLNKHILCIDLDSVIVGNIDILVSDYFMTIKDPWQKGYNSSVINIVPGLGYVWDKFLIARPDKIRMMHGDQDWLNQFPGFDGLCCYPSWACQSYKAHVKINGLINDVRLVYFHGEPKPHQLSDPFIKEHWV